VGKCLERNPVGTNCSELWRTFEQGASLDMRYVTDQDFTPFFDVANFTSPLDNALFWSGNKDFANRLAADGTKFTTLEETSTGFILNGLSWCGSAFVNGTSPSFDYVNSCSYVRNDTYFGSQGVWNNCSQKFAENAAGKINVILQPQQLGFNTGPWMAYRNTSIFHLIELPAMNVSLITSIRILLLANTTRAPTEKCGSGSLLDLHNEIVAKFHFEPECVDDPEKIIGVLCDGGQDNTPECLAAYMTARDENRDGLSARATLVWAIFTTCLSAVLLITAIALAANLMKTKSKYVSIE